MYYLLYFVVHFVVHIIGSHRDGCVLCERGIHHHSVRTASIAAEGLSCFQQGVYLHAWLHYDDGTWIDLF